LQNIYYEIWHNLFGVFRISTRMTHQAVMPDFLHRLLLVWNNN